MSATQQYPLESLPLLESLAHQSSKVQFSDVALPTLDRLQATIPQDLDPKSVATEWFASFIDAAVKRDISALSGLFLEDGFWRDMLALTWEFRTFHGQQTISKFLCATLDESGFNKLTLRPESAGLQAFGPDLMWIHGIFDFETKVGLGFGIFRLVPTSSGQWKAYTIYTNLEELKGFPECVGLLRDRFANHGQWPEKRRRELNFEDAEPAVIIIGSGQSGLDVAARLKVLGVPTLVVEKLPRVGDQWRGRYEALCLHDPIWYDHMPYLPFPTSWPLFTPAPKLADWLESYAHAMELNIWLNSTVETMKEVPGKGWSVVIKRGDGTTRTFVPRHVVFAQGLGGGEPIMPTYPGMEKFEGEVMHSSQFKTARDNIGKKVVVIGACNSAHDIARDHCEHGIDVTMYQRSSTIVASAKNALPIVFGGTYWEEPIPTDLADRMVASFPNKLVWILHRRAMNMIAAADRELLEGLKAKGFRLNFGDDNSGIVKQFYSRGGGYYIDIGASQMIIDGKIGLKSGSQISHFTKEGIVFEDGTDLPADVVIFATGFGKPLDLLTELAGECVAARTKRIMGLDAEGELNTYWRFSGVEGLYHMMGGLALCRFHSKHIALQIKAKEEGIHGKRYED
ncbi:FAD/NAD-binding domain-containing protein [Schizopora paradoxa]|uniref:FAD/NAD-binding domain-containing protein n=1 Tax=Schizopora paradoxa TaxID=27342 RepID=A0A0H2SEU5_9AGAM|nr:FAD/NAD-binding domain-containing protein [Schizopora paradoxa]